MSYLTQMVGLTVQNFVSAATGIALADRAGARLRAPLGATASAISGSIWCAARSTCCCRSASSSRCSLVWQGVPQNLDAYVDGDDARGRQADRSPRGRSPRRKRSRCSAPTAAASSTPTRRIRSRTRRRSPTSSQMRLDLRDRRGADQHLRPHGRRRSARAGRSSRRWACCSWPASWSPTGPKPAGNPHRCSRRRPGRRRCRPAATWKARRSASASPHSALFAVDHHRRLLRRGQRHARQLHAARRA